MIAFVRGRLIEALPTQAVIEVNGVGYELLIPVSSYERLPAPGAEARLLTHLVVREDSHTLYGFSTEAERSLFRLLIQTVSGVGPKMALNLLSGLPVDTLRAAVAAGDLKAISSVSGVGKKTAERIVVELKDKLGGFGPAPGPIPGGIVPGPAGVSKVRDASAALAALGVKPAEALEAVRGAAAALGPDATVEQLVRACLKKGAGNAG